MIEPHRVSIAFDRKNRFFPQQKLHASTKPMVGSSQNKQSEIVFFDGHATVDAYDVFTRATNERLIDAFVRLSALPSGARVADLGCGSGAFTDVLQRRGYHCCGVDLSPRLIETARAKFRNIEFVEGDVEQLPLADASFDGVLLSGLVHHLPDPTHCAREVFRILRPGGKFVAFDPNRMNPFMYLYRDRSSPFYSSVGVTANERPVLASEVASVFQNAGFVVRTDYLSNLQYRYIAAAKLRWLLPLYNAVDGALFAPGFMRWFRPFVLTVGEKL
jgi:ubiquinone/menaquinone biosynthesis C-methylase UbiE